MNYLKSKIFISFIAITSLIMGILGYNYKMVQNNIENGFKLKGNSDISVIYGTDYTDDGYTVNVKNLSNPSIQTVNNVNTSKIGEYEVTYTLNYWTFNKSLSRKVKVIDTEAPKIELSCEGEIVITEGDKLEECTYKVSDNYDKEEDIKVNIKSSVDTSKAGNYEIIWKATDTSNNSSEKKIQVHVKEKKGLNYIKVSLSKQTLEYYENGKLYLSTKIASGKYNSTPKGTFSVLKKVRDTTLSGSNYIVKVKYWIAFKGNKYGLHDAPWRDSFGDLNYYYNGSHGCINTPDDAMEKLYNRVEIGTPIYISD